MSEEITHKKAYKAMKSIMRYCKQNKVCSKKCIFFYPGIVQHCCISFLHSPNSWAKATVKKRMEDEKCGKQS